MEVAGVIRLLPGQSFAVKNRSTTSTAPSPNTDGQQPEIEGQ